ncbi:hypothetical protein AYJ54_26020 [Bradyrhizobium centrolobii]|uniref:YjiS-like domain-containing protein n=1 Tax=Bradyrhizobium centrolobii TaxID=1505087 RepID=A0A176YE35_9BRAD|nr:hypothetical protein AYJ54_26020 [Bradyrhizobium centrolobii]
MNPNWSADECRPRLSRIVVSVWRKLVEIVRVRRERARIRCQLTAMSERELLDCGMTRSEIAYELKKLVRRK